MFKIIALVGMLAGGAGYAAYEYTDLFGCKGKTCPLSNTQQPVAATPSCCQPGADCCEVSASCCDAGSTAKVVAKTTGCTDSCCSPKTTTTAATKVVACCAHPCIACALLACEACADCAACCGATNAKAAVAGPAALVPVKAGK
jgi:hypothetical protein